MTVWGRAVSHVAKELGISRQCTQRWLSLLGSEGADGLLSLAAGSGRDGSPICE
ncbi:MAG: helix-turn-helix domain-containing protein [Salinibacterium sp.]|nr:helix-turn-helix domain-containing protein [Salinibacterium sp.]